MYNVYITNEKFLVKDFHHQNNKSLMFYVKRVREEFAGEPKRINPHKINPI